MEMFGKSCRDGASTGSSMSEPPQKMERSPSLFIGSRFAPALANHNTHRMAQLGFSP